MPDEEVLEGGNLSRVVRIGDTVRRPTGPWTPVIHALLRHLEHAGFDGAPRVLGLDEDGREILEHVPGVTAWPVMGPLATDDGLARAADLLRRYHEAVARFAVPADAVWQFPDMEADAAPWIGGEGTIVCHNDCGAWNLVMGDERWAFIDWDVAGPRPRLWDVAYAIRGNGQLEHALNDAREACERSDAESRGADRVSVRRAPALTTRAPGFGCLLVPLAATAARSGGSAPRSRAPRHRSPR